MDRSPPPSNRILALVHLCLEKTAEERVRFLDSECGDDTDLRQEVETLLAAEINETGVQEVAPHLAKALPEHYKLIGMLGAGGMAEVFLAEDTRLQRRVAIKFLNDSFRRDPERMRRFKQEARAASALNHPNIITIHDIGEGGGVQYIVSEFVDGETLGTRISKGKIPLNEAVEIAIQIAGALDVAHEAGIIHRDLKPDNVMLRRDGSVKVVDFGIAKGSAFTGIAEGEGETAVSTSPGLILGTPKYMSPEQTRGLTLDSRSDIFSFGIVLFEMVTGHSPFGGANVVDVIAGIIGSEPRELSKYISDPPAKLAEIIRKSLAKDREDRYQTAEEVRIDLLDLRAELTSPIPRQATRDDAAAYTMHAVRRRPFVWIAAGLLGIALVSAGAWYVNSKVRTASTAAVMRTVPITSWSSVSAEAVSAAAFSPDAKMVAFASTKTGASEIWVKPTANGDPVQVTRNGFYNQYPIWSPDGQQLAYFSDRGPTRGLWRVSFTGGGEAQIAAGVAATVRPVRWSSDNKIYFTDGNEMFSVSTDPGDPQKLSDLAAAGVKPRAFGLSADGASIAVSVKEGDVWKVKTKPLNSDAWTEASSATERIDSVLFQSDGRSVYYTAAIDGVVQIFRSDGGAPVQISTGSTDITLHDISADGSKILYSSVSETSDLWSVDTKTAAQSPVANDMAEEYWPDFSPDGRNIAFQSASQADRPFRGSLIAKPASGGSGVTVLSQEGFLPAWSPDGQWVAFLKRSGTAIELWRVRPSGADASRISTEPIAAPGYGSVPYLKFGRNFAWSPDSASIAYLSLVDGVSNIWTAATDAPAARNVTRNAGKKESYRYVAFDHTGKALVAYSDTSTGAVESSPAKLWSLLLDGGEPRVIFQSHDPFNVIGISRDGQEVIVAQRADAHDNSLTPAMIVLNAIRLDTGVSHKLTVLEDAYYNNIRISREGDQIAYVTRSNGETSIWTFPLARGAKRKIVTEQDPKVLVSNLDWSPGGKSIVFGRQARTNLISMLSN